MPNDFISQMINNQNTKLNQTYESIRMKATIFKRVFKKNTLKKGFFKTQPNIRILQKTI